jgi:predicted ATPase/DNA-binding SARP family transcriptional activator
MMGARLLTLGELRLAGATFARTKPLLLLAYLALEGPRDRHHLAELFWPASQDPANSLTAALKQLKQGAPGVVETGHRHVRSLIACDAAEFLAADEAGGDEAALALYRGPFLSGVYLPGWSADLEEWVRLTRERLAQRLGSVLWRLGEQETVSGQFNLAEAHLLQALQLDPLAEEALQAYLRLCLRSGRRHHGLHTYQAFAQRLWQELELKPLEATTILAQRLREATLVATGPDPISLPAASPSSGTWPGETVATASIEQLTAFIGRESELNKIAQLLSDPACRLLTLSGPGGIGKTRLALKVASEQEVRFPNGVNVVMLASVASPELLAPSIAEALGLSLHGSETVQTQLLKYLQPRSMLIVLDNFEHLLPAAPFLTDILKAAPGVRLLVTSREQLGVPGEWRFEVEGLSYPNEACAEIESYEAAQLFLRCARSSDSRFMLTAADRLHLVRLCRLVQGMPLALELAASLLPLLSLQEIAGELERDFDLLAASRYSSERHHSLRAVLESSYQRLSPAEQALLRRLSVFRGGFSREAAEAVAEASLTGLVKLHQKSLVKRAGTGRYILHELIRQYASRRLEAVPNEQEVVLAAHQRYYLNVLTAREAALAGLGQREAAEAITLDIDNIRVAWDRAVAAGDVLALGGAAPALGLYLHAQGLLHEAEARFAEATLRLAELPQEHHEALGDLLRQHGVALYRLERYPAAVIRLQQSLEALRRANALGKAASALAQLGEAAWHLTGALASEPYFRESLRLARAAGDRAAIAEGLRCLGYLAKERLQTAAAERYFLASAALARRVGHPLSLLKTIYFLAEHLYLQGDYHRAESYRAEALALSRSLGHRPMVARCLLELSYTLLAAGRLEQAEANLNESLDLSRELSDQTILAECLRNLGLVRFERGELGAASRLLEEALAAARGEGSPEGSPRWVQPWALANALRDSGYLAFRLGERELARQRITEGLAIFRHLNEAHSVSDTLISLGRVTLEASWRQAAAHYREAIVAALKGGYRSLLADALVAVSELLLEQGECAQARGLLETLAHHPATRHASRHQAQALLSQLANGAPAGPTPDLGSAARQALAVLESPRYTGSGHQ